MVCGTTLKKFQCSKPRPSFFFFLSWKNKLGHFNVLNDLYFARPTLKRKNLPQLINLCCDCLTVLWLKLSCSAFHVVRENGDMWAKSLIPGYSSGCEAWISRDLLPCSARDAEWPELRGREWMWDEFRRLWAPTGFLWALTGVPASHWPTFLAGERRADKTLRRSPCLVWIKLSLSPFRFGLGMHQKQPTHHHRRGAIFLGFWLLWLLIKEMTLRIFSWFMAALFSRMSQKRRL